MLKWGYAAHLTLLCLVDDAFTRLWVLGSTLLTCAAYHPQGGTRPTRAVALLPCPLPLMSRSRSLPATPAAGRYLISSYTYYDRYLYSVHLKPLTGVKNLACAAIVAMAVGLGALSVGGGGAASLSSLAAVRRPMAVVGGLISHREMIMDIKVRVRVRVKGEG